MTITEFLLARIAEDEAAATDRDRTDWRQTARFNPVRVLAECEAKRRIVLSAGDSLRAYDVAPETGDEVRDEAVLAGANIGEETLRVLASVYADHPDYDQAWRP